MDGPGLGVLGAVGAYACGFVLIPVGLSHLLDRHVLRDALNKQGMVPPALRSVVSSLVPSAELSLGVALAVGQFTEFSSVVSAAGSASCMLFLAFAAYLRVLIRTRPGVPCGCGGKDEPVSSWTTVRALLFALFSATAALALHLNQGSFVQGLTEVYAALVALLMGAISWQLPAALSHSVPLKYSTSGSIPFTNPGRWGRAR